MLLREDKETPSVDLRILAYGAQMQEQFCAVVYGDSLISVGDVQVVEAQILLLQRSSWRLKKNAFRGIEWAAFELRAIFVR